MPENYFLFMCMKSNSARENCPNFFSLGGSAVLVFFFLSGYLVGGKVIRDLSNGNLNFGLYIINWMTRLWIVHLPAIFITYFLNAFTCRNSINSLHCKADPVLASHASLPPVFSQNFSDYLANAFFFQPFKGVPWGGNGPLWSLSYEFWYYLVFLVLSALFSFYWKNKSIIDWFFTL